MQASQGNTPQSADFYVNLGVEWPECRRLWTGLPDSSNPALAPCFTRSRLQTAAGETSWDAQDSGEALAVLLVDALDVSAERFWLRHSDLTEVLRRIEAGERLTLGTPRWLVHAALLMHFGRGAEAVATIDVAASRGPRAFDFGKVRARIGQS